MDDKLNHYAKVSFDHIQALLNHGSRHTEQNYKSLLPVLKIGIDHPQMRDEILIQLCRQVTIPHEGVPVGWNFILTHGWLALQVVTSTFKPSPIFAKYFEAFVTKTLNIYTESGEENIVKRFAESVLVNLKNTDSYLVEQRTYPYVALEGGRSWALTYTC